MIIPPILFALTKWSDGMQGDAGSRRRVQPPHSRLMHTRSEDHRGDAARTPCVRGVPASRARRSSSAGSSTRPTLLLRSPPCAREAIRESLAHVRRASPIRRVIVFSDSCHWSGPGVRRVQTHRPPRITRFTLRTLVMSASGLASSKTRSAIFPTAMDPRESCRPRLRAGFTVAAASACCGVKPAKCTRL